MKTTVVIFGSGALGKCFAALLAGYGIVIIYDRNIKSSQEHRRGTITCIEKRRTRKMEVSSVISPEELKGTKIDILIFSTKIMDLRAAVSEAVGLNPKYVFLPQNGIFDIRWAERFFKKTKVYRGSTTMACQATGLDQVTLFYRGRVYIGGKGAQYIADIFRKCGIEAKAYCNSTECIWAKLIFSAVMNPLPVVTGQGYDILKKDPEIWQLVCQGVKEGRAVAKALDVRLAFDPMKLIKRVRNGDLAGIAHRGSIAQDISKGRLTEIDFITGALVRQAHKLGIQVPALKLILKRAKAAGA